MSIVIALVIVAVLAAFVPRLHQRGRGELLAGCLLASIAITASFAIPVAIYEATRPPSPADHTPRAAFDRLAVMVVFVASTVGFVPIVWRASRSTARMTAPDAVAPVGAILIDVVSWLVAAAATIALGALTGLLLLASMAP